VRLPPPVLAFLDRQAAREGSTRARVIRRIVSEAMDASTPDGVDRAQIRRLLAMSPAQRVRHMTDVANALVRIRGVAAVR
jgi:hypothetical protein